MDYILTSKVLDQRLTLTNFDYQFATLEELLKNTYAQVLQ